MNSVIDGHIILTPTQPVGSGRPQRGSNCMGMKTSKIKLTDLNTRAIAQNTEHVDIERLISLT